MREDGDMIAGADRDFAGEWDKPSLEHMLRGKQAGDRLFLYSGSAGIVDAIKGVL